MSTSFYLVEPVDVLMLRGNRSFGDAGEHGEAVLPPWPSVFAGAFRAALLASDPVTLQRYTTLASGRDKSDLETRSRRTREAIGDALFDVLGTPDCPGSFRVSWLTLARGAEPVVPVPADLMVFDEPRRLARLEPTTVPGVPAALLPKVAVLRQHASAKPAAGYWLEGSGLETYLLGELPTAVAATRTLYGRDLRLGIAIGSGSGTVEKGALYTTEAVALREGVGFLVGIDGLGELLPAEGTLRLGGDGRGARYTRIEPPATGRAINGERFRVVLATPAVFRDGWLPDGCVREADGSVWLRGAGFGARLVCASVGRHGVVSGWDIAARRPKDAQRVVPAGSVYWFEDLQGDVRKLATWVAGGLWDDTADPARRAEGFNLAWLGEWL